MFFGVLDEARVNADGGCRGNGRVVMRVHGLQAQRGDFAGGVLALEGGEIDHRNGEFEGLDLGGFFDRAGGVFGDAFLDADLVHGADFADESAEGARGCC